MSSASAVWKSRRPSLQPPLRCHAVRRGDSARSTSVRRSDCVLFLLLLLFQVGSRGIEAAWAGGERGREVTDRFLPAVAQLLSPTGLFYLVTVAENDSGLLDCVSGTTSDEANHLDLIVRFSPNRRDGALAATTGLEGRVLFIYKSWERKVVGAALPQETTNMNCHKETV